MASTQNGNIGIYSGYSPGDNGWTTEHNNNWNALDTLAQATVKSSTTTAPPGSPANGDAYIVPTGATGAWASQTNKIAVYFTRAAAWTFYTPKAGWRVYDQGDSYHKVYSGSAWLALLGNGSGGAVKLAGPLDMSAAASGQIKFPAAQNPSSDPNTLDDYEEGTWTPIITQGFDSPRSYTSQVGHYTKVGDLFYFSLYIYPAPGQTRNSDQLGIGGFPFPALSGTRLGGALNYVQGVVGSGVPLPVFYSAGELTYGVFINTDGTSFPGTSLQSARPEISLTGCYKTT